MFQEISYPDKWWKISLKETSSDAPRFPTVPAFITRPRASTRQHSVVRIQFWILGVYGVKFYLPLFPDPLGPSIVRVP